MSNRKRGQRERRIRIRGVRREAPDLKKLASALILLAQAEADAHAHHQAPAAADDHGTGEPSAGVAS